MDLHKSRLVAAGLLLSIASLAQAGALRWLHIEQNPDVAAF